MSRWVLFTYIRLHDPVCTHCQRKMSSVTLTNVFIRLHLTDFSTAASSNTLETFYSREILSKIYQNCEVGFLMSLLCWFDVTNLRTKCGINLNISQGLRQRRDNFPQMALTEFFCCVDSIDVSPKVKKVWTELFGWDHIVYPYQAAHFVSMDGLTQVIQTYKAKRVVYTVRNRSHSVFWQHKVCTRGAKNCNDAHDSS